MRGGRAGSAYPAVGAACGKAERGVPGSPFPRAARGFPTFSGPVYLSRCLTSRDLEGDTLRPPPGLPRASFASPFLSRAVPGAAGPIRRGGGWLFRDSPFPPTFPDESLSPRFLDFLPERQGSYGTYFQVRG